MALCSVTPGNPCLPGRRFRRPIPLEKAPLFPGLRRVRAAIFSRRSRPDGARSLAGVAYQVGRLQTLGSWDTLAYPDAGYGNDLVAILAGSGDTLQ